MAVFTPLSREILSEIAHDHQLGRVHRFAPVERGSINTNYRIGCDGGEFFVRLYETPGAAGVAYEWALMSHLRSAGLPLPKRARSSRLMPWVQQKPVAVFEAAAGDMVCQASVTQAHLEALGEALGRLHRAGTDFGWRRRGRFERSQLERLWRIMPDRDELRQVRAQVMPHLRTALPSVAHAGFGVIHGDLFRDNVLWNPHKNEVLSALLDWESAADGLFVEDIATTVLAWCFGPDFDWGHAQAFLAAYVSVRPLHSAEWGALYRAFCDCAVRFITTRITDFHLGGPNGPLPVGRPPSPKKDFQRFAARLTALEELGESGLLARVRA